MTRCLWIDATHGAAGDMLLAALLDAGAAADVVRSHVSMVARGAVEFEISEVRRHGLRATYVHVVTAETAVHRTLDDVLRLIDLAQLPGSVAYFAKAVFGRLATAEARVHGIAAGQVHFHEVGALDAVADIVGCASALNSLGFLTDDYQQAADIADRPHLVVSTVSLGSGTTSTAHGRLPVPAPAVLELLAEASAPISGGGYAGEICTPTGAALLATVAMKWSNLPPMNVTAVGTGAGTMDPADHPNILRVVVGEMSGAAADMDHSENLMMLESTIDDLDPRLWPKVLDSLHQAGALDAWATAVLMRKGRPGYTVTALVPIEQVDSVFTALVVHTPTLGARVTPVSRRALRRDQIAVEIDGLTVMVKRGWLHGRVVTAQPEYADAVAAATRLGLPVRVVLDRVRARTTAEGHRPLPLDRV